MNGQRLILGVAAAALIGGAPGASDASEREWAFLAYTGVIVYSRMLAVPANLGEIRPAYQLLAIALAKELGGLGTAIGFEAEGQVATYLQGSDHVELNGLLVSRWHPFPWDRWLDTSFAFGAGLSLASGIPGYEREVFVETAPLLAYLLWELDFRLPSTPSWALATRIHHRSGAYGTFSGVYQGSNVIALGIKHAF